MICQIYLQLIVQFKVFVSSKSVKFVLLDTHTFFYYKNSILCIINAVTWQTAAKFLDMIFLDMARVEILG